MTTLLWILIALCFLAAFAGLVYPVIPSAPLLIVGFLIYGFGFSFTELTVSFWIIQTVFIVLLFTLDYLVSSYTVDRRGGSQAAKIATTVGLITGPFIIPGIGLLIFPFVFAILPKKSSVKRHGKIRFPSGSERCSEFFECFTERDCDVVDDRRVYHVRRLNEKKICLQVHILQEFRYSMNMKK